VSYRSTVFHEQHSLRLEVTEEDGQPVPGWVIAPEISLWIWPNSLDDAIPPPTLTVAEAKSLAEGLLRAVAIVEAAMPDRCTQCGEPAKRTEASEGRCFRCYLLADISERKQRRESMHVIRGSS